MWTFSIVGFLCNRFLQRGFFAMECANKKRLTFAKRSFAKSYY